MIINRPERSNTIQTAFGLELAEFERHKQNLLDLLRKVHGGGPKSEPFDEDTSWRTLTYAAVWYIRRPEIAQKAVLPSRRVERLRDLAKALGRARNMTKKAMQDDVGLDLFRGWCAEANTSPSDASSTLTSFANRIKKVMGDLTAIEAAASRAAREVPVKAGPPRGTGILSMHDILTLKKVYRRSTGLEPIMAAGTFADFVEEFLTAVGRRDDTSQDYVVEALKYVRKQLRKNPGG